MLVYGMWGFFHARETSVRLHLAGGVSAASQQELDAGEPVGAEVVFSFEVYGEEVRKVRKELHCIVRTVLVTATMNTYVKLAVPKNVSTCNFAL
eukprot:4297567-Amphidinium_carterae.1